MDIPSDHAIFRINDLLSYLRIPFRFLEHCLEYELNHPRDLDPKGKGDVSIGILDLRCLLVHSAIYRMDDVCDGFTERRLYGYPADAPCQCHHWKEVFISGENSLKKIDAYVKTWRQFISTNQEQEQLRLILRALLKRADFDKEIFPCPEKDFLNSRMFISINPYIRSGEPCIATTRLPASEPFGRFLAGDSVKGIAEDFGLDPELIEECIRFETNLRRKPLG